MSGSLGHEKLYLFSTEKAFSGPRFKYFIITALGCAQFPNELCSILSHGGYNSSNSSGHIRL